MGTTSDSGTARTAVVAALWDEIQKIRPGERTLIGIDGYDGSGKSYLASELLELASRGTGRPAFCISIDGFHHPRVTRRAAGDGPESFYRASYQYDVFRELVVQRLRDGLPVVRQVWDVDADEPKTVPDLVVPENAVVLVDGIFLHRPELNDVWDASIWLNVPFTVSVPRGNARYHGEHDPNPDASENARYVGGQRLYVAERAPRERATWVVDNSDLTSPRLLA